MFVGGGVLDAPREGGSPPLQITYTDACRAASPLAAAEGGKTPPYKSATKGVAAAKLRFGHARPLQYSKRPRPSCIGKGAACLYAITPA